jgi:DNA-binding transcriptional ArsR family regulator
MIRRRGKGRAGPDLESERKIVEYIKSHPKEPYTAIGKRFEYSPSHLSQIARDNGIIHYARWGEGEKTRRKIAKFLRKHPDMKVEDIAKILGYSAAYVSTPSKAHGAPTDSERNGKAKL